MSAQAPRRTDLASTWRSSCALMVGTTVTVAVAFFDFGSMNNIVMLAIAVHQGAAGHPVLHARPLEHAPHLGRRRRRLLLAADHVLAHDGGLHEPRLDPGNAAVDAAHVPTHDSSTTAPPRRAVCFYAAADRRIRLHSPNLPRQTLPALRRVTAETGYTPFASTGETSRNYRERRQWRISRKILRRSRSIIRSAAGGRTKLPVDPRRHPGRRSGSAASTWTTRLQTADGQGRGRGAGHERERRRRVRC